MTVAVNKDHWFNCHGAQRSSTTAALPWERLDVGAIIRLGRIRLCPGTPAWLVPVSLVIQNWELIQ